MALHDEIRKDIRAGIVPSDFRAADLKTRPDRKRAGRYLVGDRSYAPNSLDVIPKNGCIKEDGTLGDYGQRGRDPHYLQIGRGLYRLL
jgi:hypothetical protein